MPDLHAMLANQRAAFMKDLPATVVMRRDRLARAASMIADNAERLCDALCDDFGHRSRDQSMMADVNTSLTSLRFASRHLNRWMWPEKRQVDFPLWLLGARARVEYQPKGVVGVITPWNFPVSLTMCPLAGIFAAGNRAMVKTCEFTPVTGQLLKDLCPRYFSADELAFVSGGPDVGKAFAALPFDHLLFTGATAVGRSILHAAADNLTPVTLELGGKSPVIISQSADRLRAVERIVIGKMLNAGQVCLAPDYVMVPQHAETAIIDAMVAAASAMYPSLLNNPDCTAIINDHHWHRLTDMLDDARRKGAEVLTVNPAGECLGASNARKMPLTIVRGATDDMAVMQDEVFGPVLPVRTYETIDGAIEEVNRHGRPLALYYFGSDAAERRYILDRTMSGGVTLDDVVFHNAIEDLPFGGIGPSGMGAYHGRDGFRTFSHARAIFTQSRLDVAALAGLKPPYGAATRKAAQRGLRAGRS